MNPALLRAAQTWKKLTQRLTNWARKLLDAIRSRVAARGAFTSAPDVATDGDNGDVGLEARVSTSTTASTLDAN
ncbi:MAG: hypothetical protein JWR32_865 [Mycobacterium sp.]|nr:hypothetical protein [Mycobacterium sp.]